MIRTLTFTTLFPNAAQPVHGIFVANRLAHLLATGAVETEIVAPVPWFPSTHRRFGQYAAYAAAPASETRFGSPVHHPRYVIIPKVGMNLLAPLLYLGARRTVAGILRRGYDFDVIDAHYFYPDGVAAMMLGKRLGKPVVITARGSDLNESAEFPLPRRLILWAAREAAAVITVSRALKERLVALGGPGERTHVLRNGVDLALFRPQDRATVRAKFGLTGPTVLSVGHLLPHKGHDLAVEAVAALPEARLVIVGEGPEHAALARLGQRLGAAERIRFLGRMPPATLAELYAAADVLVLASTREGWANVLLEAMACGTPVVASDAGGSPEVVAEPAAGRIVRERSGAAYAAAIAALLAQPSGRAATRAYAERFSWDATTEGQLALFRAIAARRRDISK